MVAVTVGVDVQDNRLEGEIVGWGVGEESWSLKYFTIYGDPAQEEVWKDLDRILNRPIVHESGISLNVAAACVDSGGHHTQAVYEFCRKRHLKRIYAIKGSSQPGKPVIGRPSQDRKLKVTLFPVGTDTAKETIYSRLKITEPGIGYCHFPADRDAEYFKQLTAEKVVTKYNKGFPTRVWEKPSGRRNEALDCRVYALAALKILNPSLEALAKEQATVRLPPNKQAEASSRRGDWIPDKRDWF